MSFSSTELAYAQILEDEGLQARARIEDPDGTPYTQASLSAITCSVRNRATEAEVATPSVVIANAIFDTLQSWDEDTTGYNFKHEVGDASEFATAGNYLVIYTFTPASGQPVSHLRVDVTVSEIGAGA